MTTIETTTETSPRERIAAAMAKLGLTIRAEFVPFSKSRNAKPREDGKVWRSLNWKVTLRKRWRDDQPNDKPEDAFRFILTTDYSAGEANCPAYKNPPKFENGKIDPYGKRLCIEYECEHGTRARWSFSQVMPDMRTGRKIEPDACDVIASLVMDSDVLDCSTFEEWASNLGYDTDSRKAEAVYRACLEIALKLRNGIGEAGLTELREACQDY